MNVHSHPVEQVDEGDSPSVIDKDKETQERDPVGKKIRKKKN